MASQFLWLVLFTYALSTLAINEICPEYPPVTYLSKSVFSNLLNQVDEYVESTIIKQNNITGFITTIVYDQQILFSKGYGLRDYMNTSSPPPTGDDLVMIASNTKLFTALLTYYLRDNAQYKLSLNDPITKYLPTFSIKSIYNTDNNQITLNQLLSHTSGLQDSEPYPYEIDEQKILQTLSNRYLLFEKYQRFHYSNLGFALLGRSIEKIFCDGCYEEYIKKYILNGLNFSVYSGFDFSDEIVNNYVAYGWYINRNGERERSPLQSSGWANPNGGMLASAKDMAKFMMFLFRDNITTSQHKYQILNGTTISEWLKAKIVLNDGLEAIGTPFEMHYHQFQTLHDYNDHSYNGVWYKGKQGEVLGYRSSTMMIPQYKLGVFTVALEDPQFISEGSVWSNNILDMMLPTLDNLLYENYLDNIAFVVPENWKLLVGRYECGGIVSIKLETNQKGQEYVLYDDGMEKHNLQLFDDGIMDVFRLGNDIQNAEGTCFWWDPINPLLYFDFSNGSDNHSVSFLYDESPCIYVP